MAYARENLPFFTIKHQVITFNKISIKGKMLHKNKIIYEDKK
jgi:hypothetical protein